MLFLGTSGPTPDQARCPTSRSRSPSARPTSSARRRLSAIAYGLSLHLCLEAASRLQDEHGVSVEVVDVRTISPLDKETILASVRKTGKAMVVYEDNRTYGAGAEIAATIAEEAMFDLDGPIVRIGGPDVPAMGFASNLEHAFMPNADEVAERMLELARF